MIASAHRSHRDADCGDDGATERYVEERTEEAGAKEAPADAGEGQQLDRHRHQREQYRGAVLRDEERQRVQHAAEDVPKPVIAPRR